MLYPLTLVYLASFGGLLVLTALLAVATPSSRHKGRTLWLFAGVTLWCLADLLSNLAGSAEQVRLLARLFAPVWASVPVLVLELVTHYTGGPRWLRHPLGRLAAWASAAGVVGLVLSGALYSAHLPAPSNHGAFASVATGWQALVTLQQVSLVVGAALVLLVAARRERLESIAASARFGAMVMVPVTLLAVALNSNLLPQSGRAPHTATPLLALVFGLLGAGMLRREYFAPVDLFRRQRDLARDQLSQREEVLGAMPLGVAIVAPDLGRLIYRNPSFDALLGLVPDVGELPAALRERVASSSGDGASPAGLELDWPRTDGAVSALQLHLRQVQFAGAPARLLALRDVTARKALEVELETKRGQLMHAQKMEAIGRLSSGIAHDFNNQLTAILGNAVLVSRALGPDHPLQPDLDDIRRAAERASVLTRQLLSFGRKRQARPQELELNALLDEAQRTLGRLLGPEVALRVAHAADPAWVRLDRAHLEQVLMTLVVNARDAMPSGGSLRLGLRHDGAQVALEVEDSGAGMAPEVQARLFEPFFTTKGEQGTGLGLVTARELVLAAGGEIRVRSEPGRGACFELRFPAVAVQPLARLALARTATPPPIAAGAQRQILLVDDEDLVRRATARMLTREGFAVQAVADGPAALVLFDAAPSTIDVVLTDLAMPGMDGQRLAAELRQRRPDLPLVFMSGHQLAGQALPGNHQHFLAKPFTPGELRQVLERALGPQRPAVALGDGAPAARGT